MTSIGWHLGRAAVWVSFAAVAVFRAAPPYPTPPVNSLVSSFSSLPDTCSDEKDPHCDALYDVPASLDESAFDNQLYHQLFSPYRTFPCLPKHIHLSQATDVNEHNHLVNMTVSFALDYKTCQQAIPHIVYGTSWREHRQEPDTSPLHYNFKSSLTGEYYVSDLIYHMTLTNLKAGGINYWYQIVVSMDDSDAAQASSSTNVKQLRRGLRSLLSNKASIGTSSISTSPTLHFTTPPAPGSPTTLALIGDLGQTINSTKTMAHIHRAASPITNTNQDHPSVSMLLIVGDMSYADSDPHRWPSWFELMEPLLRSTPMQVAPGNHEIECDNTTLRPFEPYEHLFANANRIGPADIQAIDPEYRKTLWNESCSTPSSFLGHYNYGNAFYTLQHGLARIIVLNSYTDSSPDSAQYRWLKDVLENGVDRSKTPWLIVGFHCPLYTTFVGHNHEIQSQNMKQHMEPLFVQYGVNIIVSGHDHGYSRSHPLAFDKVVNSGEVNSNNSNTSNHAPIYLTLGAGGNREQHSRAYLNETNPEPWIAKRDRFEYGYGNLFLSNATHAHFNWVRDGTTTKGVQDHVWITNSLVAR